MLEFKFRMCCHTDRMHPCEAFQVRDISDFPIPIDSKIFILITSLLISYITESLKNEQELQEHMQAGELSRQLESYHREHGREVCTFIVILFYFLYFALHSAIQSCLVKCNLCAYK